MTDDARRVLVALVDLAVFGVVLYYSLPARPPLKPLAWRTGARMAQRVADDADAVALWCRTHYWRAVQP